MAPHNIEDLVEKYLAGNTSLDEEKTLRDYFATAKDIPENLQEFKPLFGFFKAEKQKNLENDILLPKPKSYKWPIVLAGIAAILIVLFMVKPFAPAQNHSAENSEMATQNTKELFMMMGGAVKESKQQLGYLNELNTTRNQLISKKISK